eukprot:195969_1
MGEDIFVDNAHRDISRRWLSESEHDENTDTEHIEVLFNLSAIADPMDEIISKYEEHSHWVDPDQSTWVINDNSGHRRMQGANSTHIINEGTWECDTTQSLSHAFENITSQIEAFNELNCEHHGGHEGEHIPSGVYIVLYCSFVLFLGCVLKYLQHRLHIPIPYTVLLLTMGVIIELIELADDNAFGELAKGFKLVRDIDPHMVLSLFIPGLIFESAFNTNYHIFLKESKQAMMLAGPGVLVNAMLIGGVMHYFAHGISKFSKVDADGYDWTWSFSIMFGSIVSATDPVAVVALLKELGAAKRLSTLIEAESLLNDGTAFVVFTVLKIFASSPDGTSVGFMLVKFVQLAFGGAALGIAGGMVCVYVLSNVYNDFEIEITLTVSMVYLFAFTGDFVCKVSGVLVIVFMGLQVSKNKEAVSVHVEESMHHFWEMIGFLANTLLFFLTGQVIAYRIKSTEGTIDWATDFLILIMLYICCHITRALAIWQMYPVLQATGYGCTFNDSVVMVYGGLRGAIGLALALIVETEDSFDKLDRDRVLFHVCGIVVLTLVVNAPTVKYVVQYLGLNKPPSDTAALFKSATHHLMDHVHHKLNEMKLDKHYVGANWLKVNELQPNYDELYESIFGKTIQTDDDDSTTDCELSLGSDQDLIINMLAELQQADRENLQKRAVEKRVISVMKSSYWTQYEKGLISADAVNILVESSEDAMDEHDLVKQRKNLKKWFSIPWYIKWMHQSQFRWIKKASEWLLFGNLGFAVEIATGFVYASKSAMEFCHLLAQIDNNIDNKHITFVEGQLREVTEWIQVTGADVVRVYPEVHTAIQTQHAAHSLLNYQKEEIAHLLHKGFLDEAEFERVMQQCEDSLNTLFHTSYTRLLDKNHDDESILLESTLFSELSEGEKKLVVERAKPSKWLKKGHFVMSSGKKSERLFVITRGTINVYNGNKIIHTKERGDVLDVYAFVQGNQHQFDFMVSTDQCMGYWLDLSLLKLLKDSNIDFWDTIWKCASCDVMRYYFMHDMETFEMENVDELDNIVYQSPLSFFDPNNRHRCEIRVNRGFAVLLNGQVVHINDIHTKATAPALLPVVDEPYVAIQESVVLYLDFKRKDYHSQKTSRLNPKLAKLMGLASTQSVVDDEEEEEYDDDDLSVHSDDDFEDKEEEPDDGDAHALLATLTPVKDERKEDQPTFARLKSSEEQQSKKKLGKMKRKDSNIGAIDRYRSRSQLNRAGQKELVTETKLNEALLPPAVTAISIETEWSIKESFEVVKYVISKHEALFEHLKKFHIQHLQSEILAQHVVAEHEDSIEMDDEEDIGSGVDKQHDVKIHVQPQPLQEETSLFARPSIKPGKGGANTLGVAPTGRKNAKSKFRSSRYLLSQQRAPAVQMPKSGVIRKAQTLIPQIIQPKNYNPHARTHAIAKKEAHKKEEEEPLKKGKAHHVQQSTEIDGWETVANTINKPVISYGQKGSDPNLHTPLKKDPQNASHSVEDDT